MSFVCPQCGGRFASGESCYDEFNRSQVIELERATYCAVHQLSVPSYWLQHNLYSRDGWLFSYRLLEQFARGGLTPAQARRQNRLKVDSGHRTFSLTKGPKLPGVENIALSVTLADVPLDTAAGYVAGVRRWAESVLADAAGLVGSPPL